jgi:hypothetical protein
MNLRWKCIRVDNLAISKDLYSTCQALQEMGPGRKSSQEKYGSVTWSEFFLLLGPLWGYPPIGSMKWNTIYSFPERI